MTNEIALLIAENPVLAITDKEKFAEFLKDIKAEIDAHVPDITTPKGRSEISSLAYKVTRSKTAIDKAGKELNAVKRKEIDAVDAERRAIWDRLEALATEVRKPLTEWEEAEEERQKNIADILKSLEDKQNIQPDLPSGYIRDRWQFVDAIMIDPELWQDQLNEGISAKDTAMKRLSDALAIAIQREKDAAELAELRAEKERRDIAEREKAEKEAAERADREARELAIAQAHEKAEREKAEAEEREQARQKELADAAERARQAEIDKARAEQVERDRLAQEQIDKANREAEELRRVEQERLAAIAAEKAAQDARDADRKHRGEVMKAAKDAIIEVGDGADITEDVAKKIVLAIVAGQIPNTRITF